MTPEQRILDMTKCMRLAMKDAAACDGKQREAYWNTAQRWGDKIDAAMVKLELQKLKEVKP